MNTRIVAIPARYAAELHRVIAGLKTSIDCDEACRDVGVGPYIDSMDPTQEGTLYLVVAHSADDATTPLAELVRPEPARKAS